MAIASFDICIPQIASERKMSGCLCLPRYKKAPNGTPSPPPPPAAAEAEAAAAAATKPSIDSSSSPSLLTNNHPPPSKMDAAVDRLKDGFAKFKTEFYDKKPELFEPLKAGQAPKVELIVVIGHSRCGGIKALLSLKDGAPDSFHFVEDWVRTGFPAKKKVQTEHASLPFDDQCAILEKEAVNQSLENLKTYPFVKEGIANGTLKLVGGHYDFCALLLRLSPIVFVRVATRGDASKMGACCCCFPVYKPARENPMRSTRESLIQHKPRPTTPYHPPAPPFITYTDKGMNAVERFKTGFENFRNTIYDKRPELFERLKTGQSPKYMVFSCADSRVCPTLTFGLQPGEAFTVRNIAGMVPAYDKRGQCSIGSAIEYAVVVLKVECIIVIGHSCCGGIKELLSLKEDRPNTFHFVDDWVKIGLAAKKKVERENMLLPFDDQCTVLEKEAVNVSLRNLQSYPFVKERLQKGTLKLLGARYDFVYGSFEIRTKTFQVEVKLTPGAREQNLERKLEWKGTLSSTYIHTVSRKLDLRHRHAGMGSVTTSIHAVPGLEILFARHPDFRPAVSWLAILSNIVSLSSSLAHPRSPRTPSLDSIPLRQHWPQA
uniref:carbonic anhydrase n=1 Tax=Oryza meridionalis TaxID=40149 RepID=A0A0E0C576_9ORYZ